MLFVPHAGKPPTRSGSSRPVPVTAEITNRPGVPSVVIETVYHLPPELLYDSLIEEAAEQLMPALAEELGVTDPFDPRQNVFAGVRYLRALLDQYDGDEALALASYNAGPGAVMRYNGVPPYPETEQYIRNINGLLARQLRAAPLKESED